MPRSLTEATRFTSTGPHAHSKPTVSTIDISGPPNPNETPAQKVARLREAARRARVEHETTWDRVVLRGRVWADRAHRVTTSALILSSVVAAGFAALSLGEMMFVNSRKKKDWLAEQERNYQTALAAARKAQADGTLTDSLRMFLVKERALEQADAEKAATESLWSRTKKSLFGGLSVEDRPGGRLASDPEGGSGVLGSRPQSQTPPQPQVQTSGTTRAEKTAELSPEVVIAFDEPKEIKAADEIRKQLTPRASPTSRGGPLDRLGEQATSSIAASSRSWVSWIGGR